MTITALEMRNEYTATAGQTIFPYTFKIFASTDLNVYQTAAGADFNCATDLITAYTVSDVGDEDGGNVTLSSGATVGDRITIVGSIPSSRTTDYQNNGDFLPDTVNDDFDRVVSLVKQVEEKVNRTPSVGECYQSISPLSLPVEAGKGFVWNSLGTELEAADFEITFSEVDGFTVPLYTNLKALTGMSNNSTAIVLGRTSEGDGGGGTFYFDSSDLSTEVTSDTQSGIYVPPNSDVTGASGAWVRKYSGAVNVKWFGAKGDGVTDDTAEFEAVALFGMPIFVPDGPYLVNNADWTYATAGSLNVEFSKDALFYASDTATDIFNITGQKRSSFVGGTFVKGQKAFNMGSTTFAYNRFENQTFGGGSASDLIYGYHGAYSISNEWVHPVFGDDSHSESVENGIYFTGGSYVNNNRVYDPKVLNVKYHGIYFGSTGAYYNNDNKVYDGLFEEVGGYGIFIGQNSRGTVIDGPFVEDVGSLTYDPIYIDRAKATRIRNCHFASQNRDVNGWIGINSCIETVVENNRREVNFGSATAISGATQALPVQLTVTGHSYSTGGQIFVTGISGMTELNGGTFKVTYVDANNITLDGIDGTGYTAYTSGGSAYKIVPLLNINALNSKLVCKNNTIDNTAFPSITATLESLLYNAPSASAEYYVEFNNLVDVSAIDDDELLINKDISAVYRADGYERIRQPSAINIAAQDTWYTIGKLIFPDTASRRVTCIVDVLVGGSVGGSLYGDTILAKRMVWRSHAGVFTVFTVGTDFETTGTTPSAATGAWEVQVVVDSTYDYIANIQVRRTSGLTTATYINPQVSMTQSDTDISNMRVRLLPPGYQNALNNY